MSRFVRRHRQTTMRKALGQLAPVFTIDATDLAQLVSGRV